MRRRTGAARRAFVVLIASAAVLVLGALPVDGASLASGTGAVAAPSGMVIVDHLWQTAAGDITDGTVVLRDATTVIAQGAVDESGQCRVSLALTRRAGQGGWIAVAFAVDQAGCRQAFEVGAYVSGGPNHVGTTSATADQASPATTTDYCTWIETYWSNGLITANSVEDDLCWEGDGTNVLATWGGTDYRYWYSIGGWSEVSHSGPYVDNNGTNADIRTYDQFSDSCGSMYYSPNAMFVYGNGSTSYANDYSYKTGCNGDMIEYIRGGG